MRRVDYQDHEGRWFAVMLPDSAPDTHAPRGVPLGPPRLDALELPLDIEVRVHNQLFHRSLLTAEDLRRRPNEVTAALMTALKVDAARIVGLYDAFQ